MEHNTTFPIKNTELDTLRDEATSYLKGVQWDQSYKAKNRDKNGKDDSILLYLSKATGNGATGVTSVSKSIFEVKE